MELFIQIRNGHPFEHPIFGENFRQAFPAIDVDNLPPEFAKFERVAPPVLGVYELCDTKYEWVNGVVKDAHHVRAMTVEEITAKQDAVKANWVDIGYASWVFDEHFCVFNPPIPYPTDGKIYTWDEPTVSWVELTISP